MASTFHPTNLACNVVILTFFPIEIGLVFFFFIDCNDLEVLWQYSLFRKIPREETVIRKKSRECFQILLKRTWRENEEKLAAYL